MFRKGKLRGKGADIILMIQGSALAYHAPEEPQLGLPQFIVSGPLGAQLVANISVTHSPELIVRSTTACRSDRQERYRALFNPCM
ncbi:hypothetical protein EDD17DRAFT_1649483 [Pisolithus thermaeus]|nr:hypothetical protein EDD17DRAFT_1649483 [Pisolithus thermaeus]